MKEMTNEEIRDRIMKGFRKAIRNLIKERKLHNQKLVILKKGKIVKVNARDL